jgi:hypothetical protein
MVTPDRYERESQQAKPITQLTREEKEEEEEKMT